MDAGLNKILLNPEIVRCQVWASMKGGRMKLNQFAKFFKESRQQTGLTLRQFCLKYNLDPGSISKLERGIIPSPIVKKLPLVFRTLRGQKVPKEQLSELVDLIRRS